MSFVAAGLLDEVDRLRAENAALREENERLRYAATLSVSYAEHLRSEMEQWSATGSLSALRAALKDPSQ